MSLVRIGYAVLCLASMFPSEPSVLWTASASAVYLLLLSVLQGHASRGYWIPPFAWIGWYVYTSHVPVLYEEYGFLNMILCVFSIGIGVFEHTRYLYVTQFLFVLLLCLPAHPPAFSLGFRTLTTIMYISNTFLLFYIHDRVRRTIYWHTYPSQTIWILYASSFVPSLGMFFACGYTILNVHTAWVRYQADVRTAPTLETKVAWLRVEDPLYQLTLLEKEEAGGEGEQKKQEVRRFSGLLLD